jgi:hypothetical protein
MLDTQLTSKPSRRDTATSAEPQMYPIYIGRRIVICMLLIAAFAIVWQVFGSALG